MTDESTKAMAEWDDCADARREIQDAIRKVTEDLAAGTWRASASPPPSTADRIRARTDALADLLISKNAAYGNSALEPVEVFAHDVDAVTRLCVRMDDKVSRLARGHEVPDEDTIVDLAGYLILLLLAREDEETSRSDGSS